MDGILMVNMPVRPVTFLAWI